MLLPITLHKHIIRIVKYAQRKESLYGSRRYNWLTYVCPDLNITLESSREFRLTSNQCYEITTDEFCVIYNASWPHYVDDKDYRIKCVWEWNGICLPSTTIDPHCNQTMQQSFNGGVKIEAEYIGDIDEIESLSTLVWMTDYTEPIF